MAQAPAPQVDPDPAKKTEGAFRSTARNANPKVTCRHSIFYYENDKRCRMFCCQCGRHRWIKIDKEGQATAGRWVLPKKKKEE